MLSGLTGDGIHHQLYTVIHRFAAFYIKHIYGGCTVVLCHDIIERGGEGYELIVGEFVFLQRVAFAHAGEEAEATYAFYRRAHVF